MQAAEDAADAATTAEILSDDDDTFLMGNIEVLEFDDEHDAARPADTVVAVPQALPQPSSPLRDHAAAEGYGSGYESDELADHSPAKMARIERAPGAGRKKGVAATV